MTNPNDPNNKKIKKKVSNDSISSDYRNEPIAASSSSSSPLITYGLERITSRELVDSPTSPIRRPSLPHRESSNTSSKSGSPQEVSKPQLPRRKSSTKDLTSAETLAQELAENQKALTQIGEYVEYQESDLGLKISTKRGNEINLRNLWQIIEAWLYFDRKVKQDKSLKGE